MSKETPANAHIEDITTLRVKIAIRFDYYMYFDEFNRVITIRPPKSNKLIDELLDPYTESILFNPRECGELYGLLKDIHLENEHTQGDLVRLYVIANAANNSGNSLKINNDNGECRYVIK
ncbi:hypothetical protein MOO46_07850 (plasmid) [Apilactobacillus apisilvae]|uniref:Uncharacterized protein n=1 Tax=Apilactobacillus apisilvae TaxID=2923364 RepID=A0ABY4PKB1_9LACO|nr:hypothetical protein [Apilactobacillus apisilvae]UQS85845.1 hypothetical protein MOO46_07850 [Apilactobacillus apisilvae]